MDDLEWLRNHLIVVEIRDNVMALYYGLQGSGVGKLIVPISLVGKSISEAAKEGKQYVIDNKIRE